MIPVLVALALAAAPAPPDDDEPWLDRTHEDVEDRLGDLVLRLDRFFGDATHADFEAPASRVRLRLAGRGGEDVRSDGRAEIRADLRLPAANRLLRRAHLLFVGQTDPDPRAAADDPLHARLDAELRASGGALELRYELFASRRSVVDAGAGARFGVPPVPYARLRWAQAVPLPARVAVHLSPQVSYERGNGAGAAARLDVERPLGTRTLLRTWGVGSVHERSRGLEWLAEAGAQRALGARTGVYLAADARGASRPEAAVDVWRVFTRLRRDLHRGWLYGELEPEIAWPRDAAGARTRTLGLTARLELQLETGSYADDR